MKIQAVLLCVVLVLGIPARASAFPANFSSGDTASLPDNVRVERDVAYGADPKQRMDVYIPAGLKNAPVIFMVHGGGWRTGDKGIDRVYANKVAYWAPKGVIFISVNYRLEPEADPLTQANDVAAALSFAQEKAPGWGGDPTRFVLMGHSAGAHLVALLASSPDISTAHGVRPWLGTVVLDAFVYDLVEVMQRAPATGLLGKIFPADNPDYLKKVSPFLQLSAKPQPMLLVCESQRAQSCAQVGAFAKKVESFGGRAQVLTEPLSHGELNKTLGTAGPYTDEVEAFMKSLGLP